MSTHTSSSSVYTSSDLEDDGLTSDSSYDHSDYGTEDDEDNDQLDVEAAEMGGDDEIEATTDEHDEEDEEACPSAHERVGVAVVSTNDDNAASNRKGRNSTPSTFRHVFMALILVSSCFLLQSVANLSGLASNAVGDLSTKMTEAGKATLLSRGRSGALATLVVLNLVLSMIAIPVVFFISKQPLDVNFPSSAAFSSPWLSAGAIFLNVNILFVLVSRAFVEVGVWLAMGVALYVCRGGSGNAGELDTPALALRKLRRKARNACFRERLLAQSLLVSNRNNFETINLNHQD